MKEYYDNYGIEDNNNLKLDKRKMSWGILVILIYKDFFPLTIFYLKHIFLKSHHFVKILFFPPMSIKSLFPVNFNRVFRYLWSYCIAILCVMICCKEQRRIDIII